MDTETSQTADRIERALRATKRYVIDRREGSRVGIVGAIALDVYASMPGMGHARGARRGTVIVTGAGKYDVTTGTTVSVCKVALAASQK